MRESEIKDCAQRIRDYHNDLSGEVCLIAMTLILSFVLTTWVIT